MNDTATANLEVFERQMAAYGTRDIDLLMTTFSQDCVLRDMADPAHPFAGHDGIRGFLTDYFANLANVEVQIPTIATNEDTVFAELEVAADWVGAPFSRENPRRINYSYAIADTIKDGLVTYERFYWDSEILRKQLEA